MRLNKIYNFWTSPITLTIVMYLLLAQYLFLKGRFEIYRFSEQKYLYEFGNLISKGFVYIAFILSFVSPLLIWLKTKKEFREHKTIIIITFIPALYFILGCIVYVVQLN